MNLNYPSHPNDYPHGPYQPSSAGHQGYDYYVRQAPDQVKHQLKKLKSAAIGALIGNLLMFCVAVSFGIFVFSLIMKTVDGNDQFLIQGHVYKFEDVILFAYFCFIGVSLVMWLVWLLPCLIVSAIRSNRDKLDRQDSMLGTIRTLFIVGIFFNIIGFIGACIAIHHVNHYSANKQKSGMNASNSTVFNGPGFPPSQNYYDRSGPNNYYPFPVVMPISGPTVALQSQSVQTPPPAAPEVNVPKQNAAVGSQQVPKPVESVSVASPVEQPTAAQQPRYTEPLNYHPTTNYKDEAVTEASRNSRHNPYRDGQSRRYYDDYEPESRTRQYDEWDEESRRYDNPPRDSLYRRPDRYHDVPEYGWKSNDEYEQSRKLSRRERRRRYRDDDSERR